MAKKVSTKKKESNVKNKKVKEVKDVKVVKEDNKMHSILNIILIIIGFFAIFIISLIVSDKTKYELKENLKREDLLYVYNKDDEKEVVYVCENCTYLAAHEKYDGSGLISSMLEVDYENEEITPEVRKKYDTTLTTGNDISVGDHYKKVLAYYGLKDGYAYWNIKYKDESYKFKDIKYNDKVEDDKIVNALLTFAYYKDGDEWKLVKASDVKKFDGKILEGYDEYILYNFEFPFNNSSQGVKNGTVGSYGITHYKK